MSKALTITVEIYGDCECTNDSCEKHDIQEVELPAKWEVCSRCEGRGSHVNPNIDGNGISAEEFEQDPEFRENYFNGLYDISCEECKGRTTVLVVDEEQADKDTLKKHHEFQEDKAKWEREDRITRYWESGGSEGSRY